MRTRSHALPLRFLLALVPAILAGCKAKEDDTGALVELPDETADYDSRAETGTLLVDTYIDDAGDDEPAHTLSVTQEGAWELSPRGGPWTALTGELSVTELLDDDEEEPACEVVFALTGEAPDAEGAGAPLGCDTCDDVFVVSFYLSAGDPGACTDPDLPMDREVRAFGWSSVDGTIYLDYAGTGVWLPWYEGEVDEDTITFSWTTELAVFVPEEDN